MTNKYFENWNHDAYVLIFSTISNLFGCRQKKGKYTRLAGRHANYNIGTRSAKRWVEHMNAAIDEHEGMKDDVDGMQHLKNYFTYTAHYIVAAKEYMRPDQLSGGTKMDAGRVW